MKKLVYLGAAASAAAIVAAPLIAQIARGPKPGVEITRAEVHSRVRDSFARIDGNRDGFVTRPEADAARAAFRAERQEHRRERREAHFDRLDANNDEVVSRDEFFARSERADWAGRGDRAARADRGQLRQDRFERRAERRHDKAGMRGMHFGGRAFERMDSDRDGRVSLAEATSQSLARFDRVDADRDGRITREERRAARADRSRS